jgi:hypothetical protein
LNGSLQYATVHTRPDLAAKVGQLQSKVPIATVETLLEANKVLKEALETSTTSIMFPSVDLKTLTFCGFSDASFASNTRDNSYQGSLILSTSTSLVLNQQTFIAPLAWSSKKIQRVVRSTLSAEACAMSKNLDRLSWIRDVNWRIPKEVLRSAPAAVAVTDCKSMFDLSTRTATPACEELRTTLECLLIKERLDENCTMRWVNTGAMLADCLTKVMEGGTLRAAIKKGSYRIFDEQKLLKERADTRQRLKWVNEPIDSQTPVTSPNSLSPSGP